MPVPHILLCNGEAWPGTCDAAPPSPDLRCDLALEEKGGEQAMLPLLARMLKMAGCSAVRRRRTCDHQHPRWRGPCCCQAPAFHLPCSPTARRGSCSPAAPAPPSPPLDLIPFVPEEPLTWGEPGRMGSHLEAGELGLDVLLGQVQPGLPKEDAQGPQPKEGGGTDHRVDPEGHALCRDLEGKSENAPGMTKLLDKARAGGGSLSRTSPCPSPCPGTHVSRVVVPVGSQDQPQEDSDHLEEGILESPQHQQLKLSPGTARDQ